MSKKKRVLEEKERTLRTSFLAGAAAGLVVDVALFPLDTLKTRLQSQFGFWNSGGFKGIYKGIGPTTVGSAPCASLFFASYNTVKYAYQPYVVPQNEFLVQMGAAAFAEVVACSVRVPTEIVKQRRQACVNIGSSWSILKDTLRMEGPRGLYHGFWTTVLRDAPYSIIQFPLWEYLKSRFRRLRGGAEPTPTEGALCGAIAGGVAGGVTTPLDVVKTQIMLHQAEVRMGLDGSRLASPSPGTQTHRRTVSIGPIISRIYQKRGILGFFAGFTPRVAFIFLGGGIFFGVYEEACVLLEGDE